MSIARLFDAVQRLAGLTQDPVLDSLCPPDKLRRILERERVRADRTGEPLSLVAFAGRCPEPERTTPSLVAKILRCRLRATDDIGWLDDRQIGVVLPTTPAAGAWKVAEDVCREFPPDLPPPVCTVYTYPLDWPSEVDSVVGVRDTGVEKLGAADAAYSS